MDTSLSSRRAKCGSWSSRQFPDNYFGQLSIPGVNLESQQLIERAMTSREIDGHVMDDKILQAKELNAINTDQLGNVGSSSSETRLIGDDVLQITCFTEDLKDVTLHFQIIRLQKQIYTWIGCNSAKFGHLYAAAPTRPNNMVSVSSILGGASDNTGSSIARRLVLKTGLNIILACNIPKNSPVLESDAERILVQKLTSLGYVRVKSQ